MPAASQNVISSSLCSRRTLAAVILWLAASYWNRSTDHWYHIMTPWKSRVIRKEMEKGMVVTVVNAFMALLSCVLYVFPEWISFNSGNLLSTAINSCTNVFSLSIASRKEFQKSSDGIRSSLSSPKRLAVVSPKPQSPGNQPEQRSTQDISFLSWLSPAVSIRRCHTVG